MRVKREKIKEEQLQGFKYFKILSGLLERLHTAGCQRDRAHNRTLHMDQYVSLLLLYMFNPICTSLRACLTAGQRTGQGPEEAGMCPGFPGQFVRIGTGF
jgi:hypothetical protein